MKSNIIGAVITIASSIASNLGVNVQKKSHDAESSKSKELRRPYTKCPLWWVGQILIILGALGDLISLGFAAQTVIASLGGGTTIVANVLIAHLWLKQKLCYTDIIGAILIIIAVAGLALASSEEKEYTLKQMMGYMKALPFIIYLIIIAGFLGVLLFLIHRKTPLFHWGKTNSSLDEKDKEKSVEYANAGTPKEENVTSARRFTLLSRSSEILETSIPILWAIVSGTIGAQSLLFAKCTMELISTSISGNNQFDNFVTYLILLGMIVLLVCQIHTLNLATISGDTMSVFPIFQAFWIAISNINAIVFFQQASSFNTFQWIMFPCALIVAFIGIYLIAQHEKNDNETLERCSSTKVSQQPRSSTRRSFRHESSLPALENFAQSVYLLTLSKGGIERNEEDLSKVCENNEDSLNEKKDSMSEDWV